MEIYKNVIHYPNLKTMLMVEKILREADTTIDREEIKRRLPMKIMHKTLNIILKYLEEKGMIIDRREGIKWTGKMEETKDEKFEKINDKEIKKGIIRIVATILKIIKKYDIEKAGIFGSYARGEQKRNSDIDIIVEFKGKKSLLDLAELKFELEKELKRKVDLITYKSINPLLKKRIVGEEIRII